jgi:hypothetical protein
VPVRLETADLRWAGRRCIVAASGPSLTPDVAALCRHERVLAVNDAYKLIPWAEVLYACDAGWIDAHKGAPDFQGQRWTSHGMRPLNDKRRIAGRYDLHIIGGEDGEGFSLDPRCIHYGGNSGFQAVNLALLFGANPVILVGFDMQRVDGRDHFFGNHPPGLIAPGPFGQWIENFRRAAALLPPEIRVLNATPNSALDAFPMVDLERVLQEPRDANSDAA